MIKNGENINPVEQMNPDINGIGSDFYFLSSNLIQSLFGKHPTENPEINPQETLAIIIFLIFGVTKFILYFKYMYVYKWFYFFEMQYKN